MNFKTKCSPNMTENNAKIFWNLMKSNGNLDYIYLQKYGFNRETECLCWMHTTYINTRRIMLMSAPPQEMAEMHCRQEAIKQCWDRPKWWTTRCLLPPMFPARNLCRQIDLQGWQRDAQACLVESLMHTQCSLPHQWFVHVEWYDDTKAADKCSGDRMLTTTLVISIQCCWK